ncbi:CPBP family intramembrane glutamic endopeptidase [Longispora sp. K20-0274]|uniref:CPBP family intramembrane glutamic endopeptidase n=1 Tax=Longispora sp. K20-0274 TaxID=3088255 RepID=UPI00399A0589
MVIAHVLVGALLTYQLVSAGLGIRFADRFRRGLVAGPRSRIRFYVHGIVLSWATAAVAYVVVLASPGLSPADLGWRWPRGDGLDWLATAAFLIMVAIGGLRVRWTHAGGTPASRAVTAAYLLPRTAGERWVAVLVALTAGVNEEYLYRGLLTAAGTRLYGLPLSVSALVVLVLFVAAHTYQGWRALPGILVLGCVFTGLFLISGSLLLPVIAHVVVDLVGLLVVPAVPRPREQAPDPEPARPEPDPRPGVRLRPAAPN